MADKKIAIFLFIFFLPFIYPNVNGALSIGKFGL